VVDANTGDRSVNSESGPDAALMARALAGLYIAGATMVVLTLVLPRAIDASLPGSIARGRTRVSTTIVAPAM